MTLKYRKQDTNLDIVHNIREYLDIHITDKQIEDMETLIYHMRNDNND